MNAPLLPPQWEVRCVVGAKRVELVGGYDDGAVARRVMRGCASAACVSYGGVVRDERGGTTSMQSRLLKIAVSSSWGKRPRMDPPAAAPVHAPVARDEDDEDAEDADGADEIPTTAEAPAVEAPVAPDAISSAHASLETPSPQAVRDEAPEAPAEVVTETWSEHSTYQSATDAPESEPAALVTPDADDAPEAPVKRPRRSRSSASSTRRQTARRGDLESQIHGLLTRCAEDLAAVFREAVIEAVQRGGAT
jgi:hypothetical protein